MVDETDQHIARDQGLPPSCVDAGRKQGHELLSPPELILLGELSGPETDLPAIGRVEKHGACVPRLGQPIVFDREVGIGDHQRPIRAGASGVEVYYL
jgi:hypothetical protein